MPADPGEPGTDLRRSAERFRTRTAWLDSRHSFSFGGHYDPANTHHGLLVVHNDDVVQPGAGFGAHRHRDMEIVTWVLSGALAHEDSTGRAGVIRPGLAQRMTAGSGIEHAERHAPADDAPGAGEPVHFVQMWVLPDEDGLEPGYEQHEMGDALAGGALVPVASGMPEHRDRPAVRLHQRRAALHVARLDGERPWGVHLPEAAWLHVYVARGGAQVEGVGALGVGDAVRLTGTGGHRVTTDTTAELLVWEMHPAGGAA